MCGITGVLNFDNQAVNEKSLRDMMNTMKHRGPDDEGVFLDKNFGLGFVRLSIIDLSQAGHQPMVSANNRYVIVFNGEIFNYIELRTELEEKGIVFTTKTDTEVLLNAYIHWGKDCLNRFNGMWAFAIYDKETGNLFAARDRFGIKPFYYIHNEKTFTFCSEIPPLLSALGQKPEPEYQSIFDFLVYNRNDHVETTFFKGIKKLQHGACVSIEKKIVTFEKWYDLKNNVSKTTGFKNAAEYRDLFASALELQMRSDIPVGVCLSGGLDSSAILSVILSDHLQKEPQTFSAVFGKGKTGDESEFIDTFKPLVEKMYFVEPTSASLEKELDHFISCQAEPIPSTSAYAEYKVMQLQKGKVGVTLTGQGADEVMGGYDYFYGFYFKHLLQKLKLRSLVYEMYSYLTVQRSSFAFKAFGYFILPQTIKSRLSVSVNKFVDRSFVSKYQAGSLLARNLYNASSFSTFFLEHFEYKLEHHLIWSDRSSMAFSIESRVPFLDHRLVEKTLATKKNLLMRNGISKYIMREALKGILPENIRTRTTKVGFETPEADWFREENWQKIIMDVLNSQSFQTRKLIDHREALEKYKKHLERKIDISREIWKWLHLELWFRKYID